MNYKKIYDSLMERSFLRILEGYIEKHHIVPRCMGGGNEKSNIAILTPEEHFLAHLLLVKIYPENKKLIYALDFMTKNSHKNPRNRKEFGYLKRLRSFAMSGENNPNFGKKLTDEQKEHLSKINTGKKGTPHTDESKKKISKANKGRFVGRVLSEEHKENMSKSLKGRKMPTRTEEHSQNISKSKKGKPSEKKGKPVKHAKTLVPVRTPAGIFRSINEAAKITGIHKACVRYRCHSDNFPEWEILK